MILRPIQNSIQICGWRLDRLVHSIEIEFVAPQTLRLKIYRRVVVYRPLFLAIGFVLPISSRLGDCTRIT
jgi:hypothetical protein